MVNQFSKPEIGRIQQSIDRAVARIVNRYHLTHCDMADMAQDAWIKVLSGYDPAKDGHATLTPEAYAYTVATTTALDYARNLTRKHAAKHASIDAPIAGKDGSDVGTLADTLAAALDDAPTMMHASVRAAAVRAALATLNDTARDAIEAWLAGHTMTGSQRIAKMRALDAMREAISARL